jgi:uncharacterized repeat protein (TIGR01451 family)
LPIRARSNVTSAPDPRVTQVDVDQAFDGAGSTVPDGVLYFVEGAGGNRDFDDNLPNPRGGGASIDQDDAATGTTPIAVGGVAFNFALGTASWLDTSMTDDAMKAFLPGAGAGTKVTARFKSKLFSFAHITVDDNVLTLYQISEPLGSTSSATPANPAPFGTDYQGHPLNDPLPNTVFDPVSRTVVSSAGQGGTPALLDKLTVTKPDISGEATVELSAARHAEPGDAIAYTFTFRNGSRYALNGAQAVLTLDEGVVFDSSSVGGATVHGRDVVVSLGRLAAGSTVTLHIQAHILQSAPKHLEAVGVLRSGTAMPVVGEKAGTTVHSNDRGGDGKGWQ